MKILIIKPSSLGDIVHANPVIHALKKNYPESSIWWLVFDAYKDVLDLFFGIDGKIVWERNKGILGFIRALGEVRRQKFDLVIDLQGLFRTALLTKLSGSKKKLGVPGMKEFSWLFVKEVYPENAKINAVKRNLEVVRYLSNFRQDIKFDLHVPKKLCSDLFKFGISEADKLIGIMPFARGESKKWPKEHYRRLIKLIKEYESGYKVVILGKEDGFEVEKNIKILNLCGKTSFYEMAQILRRCSVVVGNDTGPVQLAAAFNVPAVVIFGGSDVDETAPVSDRLSVITRRYPCSPCRSKPKCSDYPCLNDIKEQEVFEEVKKWIK